MRARRLLALLITSAFASGAVSAGVVPHLLYGKRIAGQVVDAETGQPIAGAHVAFLWESPIIPKAFTGHNSGDICYHAAATVTDTLGYFEIPAWQKWSTYDVVVGNPTGAVYALQYAPYFIVFQGHQSTIPVEHLHGLYKVDRFTNSTSKRMDQLFWGLANHGCAYGGESQKSLYPMLRAIYNEAKSIGGTNAHLGTTEIIGRFAAKAALAKDPSGAANDEELKKFIEEHLE